MLKTVILSKNKSKKNMIIILSCIMLLFYSCGEQSDRRNPSQNQRPDEFTEQTASSIEVFGNVKILKYKNISLDFPVRIEKIHVVAGQYVSKNDELITLDIDEYYNQIKTKEHELNIEKLKLLNLEQDYAVQNQDINTRYKTLSNSIEITEKEMEQLEDDYSDKSELLETSEDPEIQKLKNEIEQAFEELRKAETELSRKKILYNESAISEQEYNEYSFAFKQKEFAVQNLEYQLESSLLNKNRELELMKLEIVQKQAELDDLKLQIENLNSPEITQIEIQKQTCSMLEDEIDYLYEKLGNRYINSNTIRSDMEDGIVFEIDCTEGDSVSSGYNLISLIDLSSLYVEANVPEEFIKDIEPGNTAYIIPLADQDKKYTGEVSYMGSMAVEERGETIIPVHIKILDNDGFLLPNFNVDIEIIPSE